MIIAYSNFDWIMKNLILVAFIAIFGVGCTTYRDGTVKIGAVTLLNPHCHSPLDAQPPVARVYGRSVTRMSNLDGSWSYYEEHGHVIYPDGTTRPVGYTNESYYPRTYYPEIVQDYGNTPKYGTVTAVVPIKPPGLKNPIKK